MRKPIVDCGRGEGTLAARRDPAVPWNGDEGRERLVAVRGGIGVVDVLGHPETFRGADLRRRERLALAVADVYHNHPPELDGSNADQPPSLIDVRFAKAYRTASMQIVSRSQVFRLRPMENWRASLGKGGGWEGEFLAVLLRAVWAFENEEESLHQAWMSFAPRKSLAYSR